MTRFTRCHTRRIFRERLLAGILAVWLLLPPRPESAAAALPAAASDPWYRIESANFTCFTNGNPEKIKKLIRNLERLNETLVRTAPILQKRGPIPQFIVIFKDFESFAPYNRLLLARESPPAGFYSAGDDIGYLVVGDSKTDEGRETAYHEFIHSVLYASVPNAPLWLHEGMAELYSNFSADSRGGKVGEPKWGHLFVMRYSGMWLRVKSLFAIEQDDPRYSHAWGNIPFYLESWALVHMLSVPEKTAGQFERFVAGLKYGQHPGRTFQDVYGEAAFDSLDAALKEYVRLGYFMRSRKYNFAEEFDKSPIAAHALAQKEALCRLGDMLIRRDRPNVDAAGEHFRAARRQDPAFAAASTGLAMIAEMTGDEEEASRLYRESVGLDAESAYGLYHTGRYLTEAATRNHPNSARGITLGEHRKAREYVARSLEIDPERPYALLVLAKTYLFEPNESLEPGIVAARQSVAAIPGRPDGWLTLIELERRVGRIEEARRLFAEHLVPLGDRRSIAEGRAILAGAAQP